MSLKAKLEARIKARGTITFNEMSNFCYLANRRVSNGERRLRESDKVVAVKNHKNQVVAYKWENQ